MKIEETFILQKNHKTMFKGLEINWFIGDVNIPKMRELKLNDTNWFEADAPIWEAWGSVNGRAYQMSGSFNRKTRQITDVYIHDDRTNYYFHEETFRMLTK